MSDAAVEKEIPIVQGDNGAPIAKIFEDKRPGRDTDDDEARDTSGQGETASTKSKNQARRERRKEHDRALREEVGNLRTVVGTTQQMIQALTVGQQQTSLNILSNEQERARQAYAEAQAREAKAITDGDGAAATEARNVMNNATIYFNQCKAQVEQLQTNLQESRKGLTDSSKKVEEGATDDLTPRRRAKMEELREDFFDKHPWIVKKKGDPIWAAVSAIDHEVAQEHEPDTEDYWTELSERTRELMPQKFGKRRREEATDDEDDDRNTRRERNGGGPPLGGAGERGNGAGRTAGDDDLVLNPMMVKGLEAAGLPLKGGTPQQISRRNNMIKGWLEHATRV